ncbi:MAG: Na/Pi symporter [Gemmatimonadota bacterium]
MIGSLLGGIGLFLLGMVLMTEGLKAAAGDALRGGLARFTGGPARAVLSGVGVTALVQSSSATVLTTIGFVSAGLLSFTQAVGVIFGANLGTTSTGWIVSLLGLKVSVAALALPLVGVGALARFLLRGRAASIGLALAGFGVIFVGIDILQQSMSSLASTFDPERFPGATLGGRVLLVVVGAAMTVVLQSSSAAVATTLTALHTGTLGLGQATMLVIGQNLGTTVTAALASIGASVPARRTGLAHILFNVVAGTAAFALAPIFLYLVEGTGALPGADDPAVALAAFHTAFNALGVMILLPVTPRFAALVTRMIPDRGPELTRNLDPSVAEVPAVGVEAARRTVLGILAATMEVAVGALRPGARASRASELDRIREALGETRRFLGNVKTTPSLAQEHHRHLGVLHAIDHIDRLTDALAEAHGRVLPGSPEIRSEVSHALEILGRASAWLHGTGDSPQEALEGLSAAVADHRRAERLRILDRAATGQVDPSHMVASLEALRWMDRVVYHIWRAVHHLADPGEVAAREGSQVFDDPEEVGARS